VTRASRLTRTFFTSDTLHVARQLLGQRLVRLEPDGLRLAGIISEAEAYIGTQDMACHAHSGRTPRNRAMWGEPGHAYVYFTYGMHWMLNFVTEREGFPAAVLLRGVLPAEGVERMRERRPGRSDDQLCSGPAKLCQAFDIDRGFDGYDLCQPSPELFLEAGSTIPDIHVTIGPRVGLNNVEEPWKSKPWRFRIEESFAHQIQEEIDG
jgi:DNA-3-methyladenine glycosylase